ncbi:MAG: subclass B3 metallo-beta-lactamase [Planctomycetaceae bacterium]
MLQVYSFRAILAFALLGCCCTIVEAAPPTSEELAKDPALFLESARKQLKWDEPTEPAKVVGPIYFVGTKGLSVYLITSAEGHILINSGMPGSGPLIEASIRKLGFKPEDIKLILTGHAHCDHVGGHAYLQKLSKAKVAIIDRERALIESGGKTDFHYANCKEFAFDAVKVDQVFKDGEEIKLGNITITPILTCGHTQGSTTFLTQVKDGDKSYSVVFPNGTSVNPGYRVESNPSYPGIGDDYRRTFRTLESLEPDIWLMPHNEAFGYEAKLARSKTEGTNAWVDREGYKKWASLQRQKFEDAVAKELKSAN